MMARLEWVCTTPPARQLSVWTLGLSPNHSDLSMSQQVLVMILTASSYSLLLLGPPHSPYVSSFCVNDACALNIIQRFADICTVGLQFLQSLSLTKKKMATASHFSQSEKDNKKSQEPNDCKRTAIIATSFSSLKRNGSVIIIIIIICTYVAKCLIKFK